MIAILFEVVPEPEHKQRYLEIAQQLRHGETLMYTVPHRLKAAVASLLTTGCGLLK